ncbi:MAG: hypothetical protein WCC57_01110 [Paracoccaceae bacterium]
MTVPRRFAAMALTACLMILPVSGSTEAVIGSELLNPVSHIAAVRPVWGAKPQPVAFNWLANGAAAPTAGKAQTTQKRYRVITGRGSWICSPAGFGQRSRCYSG